MNGISKLNDIGLNKSCLLIGGGMSVKTFDFSQVPKDFTKICINDSNRGLKTDIDYLIYNDCCFTTLLKQLDLSNVKNIVCFKNNYFNKGLNFNGQFYVYNLYELNRHCLINDSDNTGLKGLVIAKHIMNFEKVFMTGFDFKYEIVDGKKQSHFYGDEVGHEKKYYEQNHLDSHYNRLPQMIEEFNRLKNKANIFNCNKESALQLFPFALPY